MQILLSHYFLMVVVAPAVVVVVAAAAIDALSRRLSSPYGTTTCSARSTLASAHLDIAMRAT